MKPFDIAIAPGQARIIDIDADYFYFLSGSAGGGDTTIVLRPVGGSSTEVYLKPGQAIRADSPASRWVLSNLKGEGTIIGVVQAGRGEFSDNRISGSVEVIDGGKNRTLAGIAYTGAQGLASSAGNTNWLQWWNPAGSNINMFVKSYKLYCNPGSGFSIRLNQTQLATAGAAGSSKKSGGGVSVITARSEQKAAGSVLAGQLLDNLAVPALQPFSHKYDEPIMVPPGWGITFACSSGATEFYTCVEWVEETVQS